MGSNASKSTSAYSVRNYSTILRNGNAFKLGDLDVSERHLLLELRRIILMDETLINGSLTVRRYQNQCCSSYWNRVYLREHLLLRLRIFLGILDSFLYLIWKK